MIRQKFVVLYSIKLIVHTELPDVPIVVFGRDRKLSTDTHKKNEFPKY